MRFLLLWHVKQTAVCSLKSSSWVLTLTAVSLWPRAYPDLHLYKCAVTVKCFHLAERYKATMALSCHCVSGQRYCPCVLLEAWQLGALCHHSPVSGSEGQLSDFCHGISFPTQCRTLCDLSVHLEDWWKDTRRYLVLEWSSRESVLQSSTASWEMGIESVGFHVHPLEKPSNLSWM